MGYHVKKLVPENTIVGEGPVWELGRQILYWADIQGDVFGSTTRSAARTPRSTMVTSWQVMASTPTAPLQLARGRTSSYGDQMTAGYGAASG